MREKPGIPDELLQTTLQDQYDLVPVTLEFLPVGLDYHAGVYRVVSEQGISYLLKVTSRPLYEPRYLVPRYLNDQGITSVVAPLLTKRGALWAKLGDWTAIVYPFIEGDSSFTGMTNEQWRELGSIFKQIHQVMVPGEWFESLRKETFDAEEYMRWIHTFETQHLHSPHEGSVSQRALRADWLTTGPQVDAFEQPPTGQPRHRVAGRANSDHAVGGGADEDRSGVHRFIKMFATIGPKIMT